jgi:GNAT superfamily N-acetyltransferase
LPTPARIREITDPDDAALAAFGRLQRAVYFEPDALIPGEALGWLISQHSGPRANFVLVAERANEVLGGTVFHYLGAAGTGFSSFMGVAQAARGQGLARQLHEARFATLDRAAGTAVPGVFIDVVNPTRLTPDELERERNVGSDPHQRRRIFARLGFRQVDVRYEQPVGGPNGGPVTNLDLLYCPRTEAETVPTALVLATMRAYWSPWLRVNAEQHVAELERRAAGRQALALLSPETSESARPAQ